MLEKRLEPVPVLAPVLAPPVVPLEHDTDGFMVVPLETVEVAEHSIVVEVTAKLGTKRAEESLQGKMTILFAPLAELGERRPKLLG